MIKVQAIKCDECKDIIYSRAQHDFKTCSCGAVSVDGGIGLERIIWDGTRVERPESFSIEVGVTERELYDDWNQRQDNYGRVKKRWWKLGE